MAYSRSIWLNIDLLTPLAFASASNDQLRAVRRFFTRVPRCRLMASTGADGVDFRVLVVVDMCAIYCNSLLRTGFRYLAYWKLPLEYW